MKARTLRGGSFTLLSFAGTKALRLASNLVLTRLLFPEAFGMMALAQVFMSGLQMFSEMGIRASIIQNERGEEPGFLNTAWSFQVLRGVVLWLVACAMALPLSNFYEEPMLALLLPIIGLNALISGFNSTNIASVNRKLIMGRLTVLELGSMALGISVMIILSYMMQSVWALVIGGLVSSVAKTIMSHVILPGIRNRPHWEWDAARNLFGFGKYIFISTVAGFLLAHGDRAILGKFISLTELAIYGIAFFLASVPMLLSRQLVDRIMFPLYRNAPPAESVENRKKIARSRYILTGGILAGSLFFGLTGDWLIITMYDPRYHLAGPVLVLLSVAQLPLLITNSYGALPLAVGHSRQFAIWLLIIASVRTVFLLLGAIHYGMVGVVFAPFAAAILTYPLTVFYAQRYKSWDWQHDLIFAVVAGGIGTLAIWINYPAVQTLIETVQ